MRYRLGICHVYVSGHHMTWIYYKYNWYIPCRYLAGCDIPVIYNEYTWYILNCISYVYAIYIYIEYMLNIHSIYNVYNMYIHYIYMVYSWNMNSIICVYTRPGGWCCGGGQGPIPPAPPAITSPKRVMTFILLNSCAHLGFLLWWMWRRRARHAPGRLEL